MSTTYMLHSDSADSEAQAGFDDRFKPFWRHELEAVHVPC